jgi:hypothetical protein
MFSFCAWVREAIKAKEEMQNKISHTTFEEWLEKEGIEIPSCDCVKSPELKTEQDVLDSWDINKLTKYLRLETFASHYGKLIHPNGAYSKARKDAYNAINNPITKEGTGRDIILYYKEPSVSIRSVDSVFLKLQDTYRGYEKELNRMKAEVKDTVNELNRKVYADYLAKVEEWRVLNTQNEATRNELYQKFQNWKSNELERISKLKITIPDSLKDTFKIIKEVGDTSK